MRSVNQNHHLYVVKNVATVDEMAPKGTIEVKQLNNATQDKDMYFLYKGRDGVTRSDLIPIDQITYMKHVPAAAQATPLKKVTVTLDTSIGTNGLVVGRDYVLNIAFQQFYGLSPEDTYVKTVALHVTSKIANEEAFYAEFVKELNASFSREIGATADSNPYLEFDSDADGLYIIEKPQDKFWSLGKWEFETLVFDVFPSTIYFDNDEVVWGEATPGLADGTVPNSKRMADLEWFTFGERADHYRGMGYPNNFDFIPMIDPDDANGYDVLEIHFAYQGSCEDIQKSEKDITLVGTETEILPLKNSIATITGKEIVSSQVHENNGNEGD